MKIEQKRVNFTDDRGTIMDIIVDRPFDHCAIIYSKKGSVRANHYHKESIQSDFIVSGKMLIFSRKMGSDVIEEHVANANDLVEYETGEAHEFIALEDLVFVTIVKGPRGGGNYENDTFRLATPLHEEKGRSLESILK